MLAAVGRIVVGTPRAEGTENRIACLTEEQLLVDMNGTLRNNLSSLPRHQIKQLVDEEGRGQSRHPSSGYGNELPAYRTPERASVSGLSGSYSGQAVEADSVGALQQLGGVLLAIVHA